MNSSAQFAIGMVFFVVVTAEARAQSPNVSAWDSVGRILQTSGSLAGGYYRYNLPRRDITLRIGDVTVSPSLALGAWAGFSGESGDATMMGDLVLTSPEVKPVQAELRRQRLDVTAVHNHLTGEMPAITYLHFHGQGEAIDLARRLDHVIALTGTPRPVSPPAARAVGIDSALVFKTLGRSGRAQGDVAQISFVLVSDTVRVHGRPVTPAMAFGTPINIQMVTPSRAVATGDFAVTTGHATPVVTALTDHGIIATAMHSHLIGESPTLYYIHFWADGPLPEVLAGLRAALDAAR